MNDFLSFNKLITPVFIHAIYWIGVLAAIIVGLGILLGGGSVLKALLMILLGPILVRIGCEMLIVLFRINDHLAAIRGNKGLITRDYL